MVLPAVSHGAVRDQHRAHRSDPHALVDDTVQVRQAAAVRHTHLPLAAHLLVQLLLHALLHLQGAGHSDHQHVTVVALQTRMKSSSVTWPHLRVVQQVGQDPQQRGGRRLHSGSKGLRRCHQDVVVCHLLIRRPRQLLTTPAVHLALEQGIEEVTGVAVTQRCLDHRRGTDLNEELHKVQTFRF